MIRDQNASIMDRKSIESFFYTGEGYKPFLIRDGWQVAQLNFLPGHEPRNIRKMEVHRWTDEVFVLVKGKATLITVRSWEDKFVVDCTRLKKGVTYNVPAGVWHNIAMGRDAQLIIVERSDTHLNDVNYRMLSPHEVDALRKAIRGIEPKKNASL